MKNSRDREWNWMGGRVGENDLDDDVEALFVLVGNQWRFERVL
jgi:hypothetical protein